MRHVKSGWVVLCLALCLVLLSAPAARAENYAILFAGGIDIYNNMPIYYTHTTRMYEIITGGTFNFKPENVWILAADGLDTGPDKMPYNQTSSDWSSVTTKGSTVLAGTHDELQTLMQSLPTGPADLLYMWTFDHGNGTKNAPTIKDEEYMNGWGAGNQIQDDELGSWANNLVCGRKAFIFGQCYSGGMIDDLNMNDGKSWFACAATNHYEPSNNDYFIMGVANAMSTDATDDDNIITNNFNWTHDIYQYAYTHDSAATNGEGPGGLYANDVEHPFKTGIDMDLTVAVWAGAGAGGTGDAWSNAADWQQQPTIDRTVRVNFSTAGQLFIDTAAQAGYLVVQSAPDVQGAGYLQLHCDNTLHSIFQVIGDDGYGVMTHNTGSNTVDDTLYIGYRPGSLGYYILYDGSVYAWNLSAGRQGVGIVYQEGGSVRVGMLHVGEEASGGGLYRMDAGILTTMMQENIGEHGSGDFDQVGGTHIVNDLLALGRCNGSVGRYTMWGVSLTTSQMEIGTVRYEGGQGAFYHHGGLCTVTDTMWIGARGSYGLVGNGQISCANMSILRGGQYKQSNGTSSFTNVFVNDNTSLGKLEAGTMEVDRLYLSNLGRFDQTGGLLTAGKIYISSGAKFTQTGGDLFVTDANCSYVGYSGKGSFEQTAGNCHVYNNLYVGYGLWSSGTYTLNLSAGVPGSLAVDGQLRIGADSGRGRFEYLSYVPGTVTVASVVMGGKGTLAIGFNTNVSSISNGTIFGGAAMTGLNQATLEIANGATVTQDVTGTFRTVRVGSDTGGTFDVFSFAGANVGYMEINAGGLMNCSGGSLQINNGGLHLAGQIDFHGSYAALETGDNCLVNLAQGQFLHAGMASVYVTGASSLTILPPGFNPDQFGVYVNSGRTHTAGSMLVIGPNDDYTFQGHLDDHVQVQGHLAATSGGYVHMSHGLEVDGTGSVDLGDGTLTVNDASSHLGATASLTAREMQIGAGGSGSFAQLGGTLTVGEVLTIGRDAGDVGQLDLSDGSLIVNILNIGLQGRGTLRILNASSSITVEGKVHLGLDPMLDFVPGATIHMIGAAFENESTNPANSAGLANLTMVFEGGADVIDPFEVAGAHDGGFTDNFALGTMILGGSDVGNVQLVDRSDNGQRTPSSPECLFLFNLTVNAGSSLDLNGLDLYLAGDAVDLLQGYVTDGGILDSAGRNLQAAYDAEHDWTVIPEPATLSLLALGGLALLRRRK